MADSGWPWVGLVDVADLRLSSVDKKITPGEKAVRLCNYSDVYNHSVLCADMDYMEATATEREIQNCHLEVGDVIITKDSETPDDIGVPAVVREKIPDLVCGYHLAILRPVKSALDGEYLNYALGTETAKRQFQMYANGVTRFGLRAGDIKRVGILLPPLPDQRKIAAILSSVDDVIEKTQAVIDQVQVVKRGLMQDLLTRGLPGRHTRFKQTQFGQVPETWIETDLGSVIELKRGYDLPRQHRTTGAVPVVSSSGVTDTHGEARVKGPGVVTGRYGNIGQVFFVNDDFWPLNTTLYVRDFKGNDPRFISHLLRGLDFSAHSGKTAVPGVNRNHLHRSTVVFPPDIGEQRAIATILSSVDDPIERNRSLIDSVEAVKSALMSVLLTGELRVTPDPAATI